MGCYQDLGFRKWKMWGPRGGKALGSEDSGTVVGAMFTPSFSAMCHKTGENKYWKFTYIHILKIKSID